jgi:hypothetical protein
MGDAITRHAEIRSQQRAIPHLILDWLRTYGAADHDGRGAEIRYFDKGSRKKLEQDVGSQVVSRLKPLLESYIIECQGVVVTVGRRYKRISNR